MINPNINHLTISWIAGRYTTGGRVQDEFGHGGLKIRIAAFSGFAAEALEGSHWRPKSRNSKSRHDCL